MGTPGVVGREAELDRIARFTRGLAGGAGALLIEGDAGTGKTTLWEEGLSGVQGDAEVITCRPVQSEAMLSYAGLSDIVGGAHAELLAGLPVPQQRALEVALGLAEGSEVAVDHRAVGAGVRSVLAALAREHPLIIAVDDLQWLDRPSARALGFAFRRMSSEPIGVVATLRTESEGVTTPELADIIRDRKVERLPVGPLSLGAIERLLADRLGLSLPRTALVRLHETSRGNPLFALELGRALVDAGSLPGPGQPLPVPGELQALLVQRVRRLPPDAREALLLASLLSQPEERTLAHAFGPGWDRAVDRGRNAGIIDVTGGTVRFAHPLLAAAVATAATERERQNAHLRLADSVGDDEERARHLALAATGPDENVAAELEQASGGASRRGAPDAAAELAELARKLTPGDRTRAVWRRVTMAGEARFAAGDSQRALELFTEAVAVAAPGRDRGDALWRLGRVHYQHDDVAGAPALLEEALQEVGDDLGQRAAIESDLVYPYFAATDLAQSLEHARRAAELAETVGADHLRAGALAQVAVVEFLLGHGVSWELLGDAHALENWDEPRPAAMRPTMIIAHILLWLDRPDEAHDLLVSGERELVERGDDASLPWIGYRLAEIDWWRGDWERAYERAIAADDLVTQVRQGALRPTTRYVVALIAAHLGQTEEAASAAREGVAAATEAGLLVGIGMNLGVLGFLEFAAGRPEEAHQILGPLLEATRGGHVDEPSVLWWLPEEIEALVALDDLDYAESLTEWLEERSRAIDRPTGLASAARCRALLAAARGRTDDALATCEVALGHHDRAPVPFARARTSLVQGQIARRARKWGAARTALGEALAGFEQLGAKLWIGRARDELARIGGRAASPTELTESERQIAELVASGRSNRQVAETLFLSPKTVSASLARVYRKLGVSTRTEMAARLRGESPLA